MARHTSGSRASLPARGSATAKGSATARGSVPTLATVAAVAGVSPATASRVINGSSKVAPQLRAAVEQAIEQLGYVPNRAARSLVTRRSNSIALVVREQVEFGFADAYLSSTVVAASQTLVGTGFQLVVLMAQNDVDHAELAGYVRAGHVDGVILVSVHAEDPLPRQLARAGIPTVLGGRPHIRLPGTTYVDVDNLDGGRQVAARLIGIGRRRLATIAGPADMTAATDRLAGFRAGLDDAGVHLAGVAVGDFHRASGEAATLDLLAREPQLDGIFAASDLMAVGAVTVLRRQGRRVPEDVAVIGYDDLDLAQHTDPPLTTVHQPVGEAVRIMVGMLLQQVGGGPVAEPVVLPTHLVIRSSG